ncbi:hypothetical protein MMC14_007117 [Varicellaria rhodocarpa]|nr:hypothetical protein [Varicellaria rhodocarpa]
MLTRRLFSAPHCPSPLLRTFTTSIALHKVPSLADITPDSAPSFDARQKEFRDSVKSAQKAKAQQDSQSVKTSEPSSSSPSSSIPQDKTVSGVVSEVTDKLGIGSLSTASTGIERERDLQEEGSKRKGALSSLIYGTHEGRQMDKDIEKSFSQVLARGKYVHSIVLHQVKPDKVDEYVELVGKWYPRMAGMEENHVHLVGSWRTEVGDCDTFGMLQVTYLFPIYIKSVTNPPQVHIWEYQRYHGYHTSLHSISSHPEFPAFDARLKSLITHKQTSLMQEFSFWPTTPPRHLGGLFELRSYTLHPGNLLEWEQHWRTGLKARREVMEGVGAWFVQIGDLNTVHHLWQFADLEERKARREMSWGVEGWGDTVHKTVPLIQTMKSRILIPMPWSPVA